MTIDLKPTYRVVSRHKRMLADIITPVSIYLRIRDRFLNSILLESSDYHGSDNSFSYIAFDPVARFSYDRNAGVAGQLTVKMQGGDERTSDLPADGMLDAFKEFKA